jgi:hypothetical protein
VPTSRFSLPWPKCFNFTSFGKPVFAGILGKLLQDGFFPKSSSGCFLHYNTFIVTISAGHYPITVGRKWMSAVNNSLLGKSPVGLMWICGSPCFRSF